MTIHKLNTPVEQEIERIQNEEEKKNAEKFKIGDLVKSFETGSKFKVVGIDGPDVKVSPIEGGLDLWVSAKQLVKNDDSTTVPIETGKENDDDPSFIDDPSAIDANPKNKKNAGPKFKVGDEVRHVDEPKARGKVQQFYGPDKQGGYEYAVHWHTAPMGWDSPSQDPEEDLKKA